MLDKIKSIAFKNEEKYLAYEIVELEKVLVAIYYKVVNRSQILIQQADQLQYQNDLTSKLSNLSYYMKN